MSLDPFIKAHLLKTAKDPRVSMLDAATARAQRSSTRLERWPGATSCSARDLTIPMSWGDCKARYYQPEANTSDILPLLIYFHGGGFVICDVDTHDGPARSLSGGANVAVLSVDYRLAPEHVYPAAQNDAFESLLWAHESASDLGIDPSKVLLCGDSAGANLAIGAARRALSDNKIPALCGQLLFYPVTDAPDSGHGSYEEFSDGFGLTAKDMEWFWNHYLEADLAHSSEVAHLRANDLSGLPPTMTLTAACDVLRDEGEAFAMRLAQEGVQSTLKRCPDLNHNFLAFSQSVPIVGDIVNEACDWIRARVDTDCP